MKTKKLYISGMHCSSCESIIENKLRDLPNITSVEVSEQDNSVTIAYSGELPTSKVNDLFKKNNYKFSEENNQNKKAPKDILSAFLIALIVIISFFILEKSGFSNIAQLTATSPLSTFFFFGIIASISSCAALVGGIVLSLSKSWDDGYSNKTKFLQRAKPQMLFNLGRLLSYGILGGFLGMLGGKLSLSLGFSSALIISVSVLMIILGIQLTGIGWFKKVRIALPKSITKHISRSSSYKQRAPFIVGALTFFLPCGFTVTAQGFALISGSFIQGSLIMLMFAIGTMPVLLAIGLTSVKFISNSKTSLTFSMAAGIMVIFFALFNINAQLNVLGFSSAGDLLNRNSVKNDSGDKSAPVKNNSNNVDEKNLPPIVSGKQVVKIIATSSKYTPSQIRVRKGIPVRLEVEDRGTSGCTNAIISKDLFKGQIDLAPGEISVKEFTPTKTGRFKFSCWMGMVSGTIEVL